MRLHSFYTFLAEGLEAQLRDLSYGEFLDRLKKGDFDEYLKNLPNSQNVSFQRKSVAHLYPTQKQIDVSKSLSYPLGANKKHGGFPMDTLRDILDGQEAVELLGKPLVVLDGKYILDGHHKWSQVFCVNREAEMSAVNIETNGRLSPVDALKILQFSIKASEGSISSNEVVGDNLYDLTPAQVRAFVNESLTEEHLKVFVDAGKCKDRAGCVDFVCGNVAQLCKNRPASDAVVRSLMPQPNGVSWEDWFGRLAG